MQSYQLTPLKHKILLGARGVDKNIIRIVIYSAYEQQTSLFLPVCVYGENVHLDIY